MSNIENDINDMFLDTVLSYLCNIVNKICSKDTTIPCKRCAKIAYIYLNSDLTIGRLIKHLNKEDVIVDIIRDFKAMGVSYNSQDLENGYNYAIGEVLRIFVWLESDDI